MNILKLIDELKSIHETHGDISVMVSVDECGVFDVHSIKYNVAGYDEYPEDWNMPEGFQFVNIKADA